MYIIIKVSGKSNAVSLAGAIAGEFREKKRVEIHAIGAAAVNQAVKAVAIARGYVASSGYNLIITPAFAETQIDGAEKTVIKLIIEHR